ncbi:MAG: rhodanese-like domain-containing protein [Gemmatimonadota bacterium]|nr:rhodanese-like domain-containing protein [Gemmatimonadota bacterium]
MANKSGSDLIEEAKQRIREVTPAEARQMRESDPSIVYLDVREPNEWNLGRIPGALFIARGNLESRVESTVAREKRIIIYCARGNRSALAADTLQQMGYADVASMSQGFIGWVDAGGEVED